MNVYNFDVQGMEPRNRLGRQAKERKWYPHLTIRLLVAILVVDYIWNEELETYQHVRRLTERTIMSCKQYTEIESDNLVYGIWHELYPGGQIDYFHDWRLENKTYPPDNTLAFVFPFLDCPERPAGQKAAYPEDSMDNTLFYDEASMLKMSVCTECENMTINNVTYNVTLYALMTYDAIECLGPDGEMYDRIQILEDLQYFVKLLGPPFTAKAINETTNQYLKNNVENDVGIKDLAKLQVYNRNNFDHDIVVLLDYDSYLLSPIDDLISELHNSSSSAAFSWRPDAPNMGVHTGLLAVKPDMEVFHEIGSMYRQETFDSVTGWPSGVVGFPGEMGTSGILGHYYKTKMSSAGRRLAGNETGTIFEPPMILDRCIYGNNGDGDCADTNFEDIKVARIEKDVCGKPYDCPDNSHLPENSLCHKYEEHWFASRERFETELFDGGPKMTKNGEFNKEVTKGYCKKAGRDGYEPMLNPFNVSVTEVEPLPRKKASGGINASAPLCSIQCSPGEYVTPDCTCSTNECDACPEGTTCQESKDGNPPLCIDCECGFCDYFGNSCCKFNGKNKCKSASTAKECKLQNAFFPAWPGAGNVCPGVKISANALPSGCGCQPNSDTPCTYVPSDQAASKCFIVRSSELLVDTSIHPYYDIPSSSEARDTAASCRNCLASCDPCIEGEGQDNVWAMQDCLGFTISKKKKNEACRSNCAAYCKHNFVV